MLKKGVCIHICVKSIMHEPPPPPHTHTHTQDSLMKSMFKLTAFNWNIENVLTTFDQFNESLLQKINN